MSILMRRSSTLWRVTSWSFPLSTRRTPGACRCVPACAVPHCDTALQHCMQRVRRHGSQQRHGLVGTMVSSVLTSMCAAHARVTCPRGAPKVQRLTFPVLSFSDLHAQPCLHSARAQCAAVRASHTEGCRAVRTGLWGGQQHHAAAARRRQARSAKFRGRAVLWQVPAAQRCAGKAEHRF